MRLFLLFLLFSTSIVSKAQTWTDSEFDRANTATNAHYLSDEEKNIVMFMNLIRIDGEKFYYTFLQDYIDDYNAKVKKYRNYNQLKITTSNPYYLSLLKQIRVVKNFPLLYPDERLTSLSKSHAEDINRNNLGGHVSSNGDKLSTRLSKYFKGKAMSENISFGYFKSLDIVCQLLLDCGVPSLGHRLILLDQNNKLNTVGVSIQSHPAYSWCAVIDYVSIPN